MPNALDALHRGYQIHSWAVQLPNGKFKAQAIVTPSAGVGDPEEVDLGPAREFDDGNAAAIHASDAARRQIDNKL